MGWLDRLFPGSKKPDQKTSQKVPMAPAATAKVSGAVKDKDDDDIPAAKVGLDGKFDESGLAKRVALAFDEDSQLDDVGTLYVAQLSSKVVLKGKVPSQDYLDKAIAVARKVDGATEVDASQVTIG